MVTYRPLAPEELRPALRLVLDRHDGGRRMVEAQVDAMLSYVAASNLRIDRQWGAFEGRHLVEACLCIVSPGRSAMLFLPDMAAGRHDPAIVVSLLQHVVADAPARDVRLLQAMLAPDAVEEESILSRAGFRFLAELIYMRRDAVSLFATGSAPPRLSWVTYSDERHALFAETVAATYEESLDCPGLAGLRTIEDVMASHRAAGEFDPRRWFLATDGDAVAGVLLLTRVPGRDTLDIVYMGLVAPYRKRGLGREILHQAVKTARDHGFALVTLAVDAANTPALRLYQGCGFVETTRRRAWIATSGSCGATQETGQRR